MTEPKGVFGKAGQAPPPPAKDAAVPSRGTLLPASGVGRFAFYALIPSLLLPLIVTVLSIRPGAAMAPASTARGCRVLPRADGVDGVERVAVAPAFRDVATSRVSAGIAVDAAACSGDCWSSAQSSSATTSINPGSIAIAIALMVLSIIVFVAALIRKTVKTAVVPEVAVGLSRYAAVLGWGYLVAVVIAIVVGVFAIRLVERVRRAGRARRGRPALVVPARRRRPGARCSLEFGASASSSRC